MQAIAFPDCPLRYLLMFPSYTYKNDIMTLWSLVVVS
jgi:hypothetical protein